MSATSDKIKQIIDDQIKKQKDNLNKKVDTALSLYKKGDPQAEKVVEEIEKGIDDAQNLKDSVQNVVDGIDSVKTGFDNTRTVAETTEKASTIGSALNPAAAAIAYAQKFIIDTLKKEIKDIDDELNVAPKIIESFDKFLTNTRKKLAKEKERREQQKRIAEENRKMLI